MFFRPRDLSFLYDRLSVRHPHGTMKQAGMPQMALDLFSSNFSLITLALLIITTPGILFLAIGQLTHLHAATNYSEIR